MKKPKIKARKWDGSTHGLCADCQFLLKCAFPISEKHTGYIVTACNEHVMDIGKSDIDIILLDSGEIYVR